MKDIPLSASTNLTFNNMHTVLAMIFATKSNFISVVQEHHDTTIPLRPCKTEKPNSFFIDLIFGKYKQFPFEHCCLINFLNFYSEKIAMLLIPLACP